MGEPPDLVPHGLDRLGMHGLNRAYGKPVERHPSPGGPVPSCVGRRMGSSWSRLRMSARVVAPTSWCDRDRRLMIIGPPTKFHRARTSLAQFTLRPLASLLPDHTAGSRAT